MNDLERLRDDLSDIDPEEVEQGVFFGVPIKEMEREDLLRALAALYEMVEREYGPSNDTRMKEVQ